MDDIVPMYNVYTYWRTVYEMRMQQTNKQTKAQQKTKTKQDGSHQIMLSIQHLKSINSVKPL